MAKQFASQGDMTEKKVSFDKLAEGVYAYTAEGDPNAGVIVGDDGVMVIEALATPVAAQSLIAKIKEVTDKPIKYLVLSHYHAVRVMGASAYGAEQIICSEATYDNIVERGQFDFDSEVQRFPRLFDAVESVPGLTWPTMTFKDEMTIFMGKRKVELKFLGRAHTKGDVAVWLPEEKIVFAGDLVEYDATPYTGDAFLSDWPTTLDNLRQLGAEKLVPGRGSALTTPGKVEAAISNTQAFLNDLFGQVRRAVAEGKSLKQAYDQTYAYLTPKYGDWVIYEHCVPFDIARAYDEAGGREQPQIWTAERDLEMWNALQGD